MKIICEVNNVHKSVFLYMLIHYCTMVKCQIQMGPDPWHYDSKIAYSDSGISPEEDIPPDIKIPIQPTPSNNKGSSAIAEWSFRRIVAILVKSSRIQKNDDGSIDIPTHMKFSIERWENLNRYLNTDEPLSEEAVRRVLVYIEEAIYKPTIAEKTIMAWNEYIKIYLIEYKEQIMVTLITLSILGSIMWMWKHVQTFKWLIIFLAVYFYETIISYKEAEQKEFDKFRSAIENCQWKFWSRECEVPKPDLLIFLKHMHPVKILVRMFSGFISEPITIIYETFDNIIQRLTGEMWLPFGNIVRPIIMILIVVMLILFVCNAFVYHIPNLSSGFMRLMIQNAKPNDSSHRNELQGSRNTDAMQPATIDRLLDVCARALDTAANNNRQTQRPQLNTRPTPNIPQIRRSASTGRLPNLNKSSGSMSNNSERTDVFAIGASGDHS